MEPPIASAAVMDNGLTARSRQILRWLFLDLAPRIPPDRFRFCLYLNFVAIMSWIGHASFIPLFAHLQVPRLAVYNIGSVILFTAAWAINRQGHCYGAMWLMVAEYVCHAWLAVRLVGWEFGFQYYSLGWSWVPFMAPAGRRLAKLAVFVMGCGAFIFLTRYSAVRVFPSEAFQLREAPFISAGNVAFFCCAIAFSFVVFRNHIAAAEEVAREANLKSERLLHSILPLRIAERLKQSREVIADVHHSATVLFLDIVDFTPLTARMQPAEMVNMLNAIFGRLDALTAKYQIEKIKTVGDAYMVAAGVPAARADHAEVIGSFAIDALAVINGFTDNNGKPMRARIGVDTGSAVAGVIGQHKFLYDLWGDMVNTASRMESHGMPDRIQVTRRYYELTRNIFVFERRGVTDIKGKGPMETFFLLSRRIQSKPQ